MISSKIKQKFRHLKPLVIALRKGGRTYKEIRKIYHVPKSTLSNWLKNVKIPLKIKKQMQKRQRERNVILGEIKRGRAQKLREKFQNEGRRDIKRISIKDLRFIGAALYWAEGGKNKNQLRFSNSDPGVIKTMMNFFCKVCNISKEKIKVRIHLYPGINQEKATNYWKGITGLPRKNFHPPQVQVSRASKGKRPRNTLPYGTLHLTVCDTAIASKVKGWIQGISEKI